MNMKGLYHGGHERNHNETFKDKQDLGQPTGEGNAGHKDVHKIKNK